MLRLKVTLEESFGDGKEATSDATLQGETLLENLRRKQSAVVLDIVVITLLQLLCRGRIEDEGIHFVIETK